jgi:hypothetical protein
VKTNTMDALALHSKTMNDVHARMYCLHIRVTHKGAYSFGLECTQTPLLPVNSKTITWPEPSAPDLPCDAPHCQHLNWLDSSISAVKNPSFFIIERQIHRVYISSLAKICHNSFRLSQAIASLAQWQRVALVSLRDMRRSQVQFL